MSAATSACAVANAAAFDAPAFCSARGTHGQLFD